MLSEKAPDMLAELLLLEEGEVVVMWNVCCGVVLCCAICAVLRCLGCVVLSLLSVPCCAMLC